LRALRTMGARDYLGAHWPFGAWGLVGGLDNPESPGIPFGLRDLGS
jgi:hypothetical protein